MSPVDDRHALARAYDRATSVVAIAIGMVLPPVAGHYADERWGTRVVFTAAGAVLGLTYGIWHLLRLGAPPRNQRASDGGSQPSSGTEPIANTRNSEHKPDDDIGDDDKSDKENNGGEQVNH